MILTSAYFSIVIQFLVGLLDIYGLSIEVPHHYELIRDILKLELLVQGIEFCFYVWLIFRLTSKFSITVYRYADWMFSTPLMLISLIAYLNRYKYFSMYDFFNDNAAYLFIIIFLNFLMLLCGLMGELGILNIQTSVFMGFIPFVLYFYYIYVEDLKNNHNSSYEDFQLFWFFFFVWSLYGIAATLSYINKNAMYNILDLFAKNLFGVFLVYNLYIDRIV